MYTNLIVLAAALASSATAFDCHGPYFSFYNRGGPAMSYQRLDPALFPGVESPHLHSFDGGNGLTASLDFAATQASTCTTARIKPDKSVYWRPRLFWNGNNTGFYAVPDEYLKIYYKFGDSGNVKANVSEFPEDFAMIAGNAMLRHDDGVIGTGNSAAIGWSCKGTPGGDINAIGFPKGFTSCPDGFAAQITFPACWNGQTIDPKNPSAHMAYPTAGGLGLDACPTGFKVARFPTIFIEFWYDVSSFDGQYSSDSVPWVLAQGDSTGFGWHADFRNGWEKGVLAKQTADEGYCNCGCGCGEDQMKQCFGADNVNDDSDPEWKSCTAANVEFPGDDISPLQSLPGCNPIQSGPADATQASGAECVATPMPAGSNSSSSAVPTSAPVSTPASQAYGSSSAQAFSASGSDASSAVKTADASDTSAPSSLSLSLVGKGEAASTGYPRYSGAYGNDTAPFGNHTVPFPKPSRSGKAVSGSVLTAAAEATGECAPTIYTTLTEAVTVTVSAGGSMHKRHVDLHKRRVDARRC